MDIKLTAGDIDVSTGDLVLLDGEDAIKQHISIRLQFFAGEWFLDVRLGMPYFEQLLVKNPSTAVIRAMFQECLLETPGISEVRDLTLDYVAVDRQMTVVFTAVMDDGEVLDYTNSFIIGAS